MKLNKFFFGLLTIPAFALTGCGEYEDVDTFSPEADADATGAFFSESASSETLVPGETSFEAILNRAVSGSTASIPVDVTLNADNFFSLSAQAFSFDAESQESAPIAVSFAEAACTFQKTYELGLQVLDGEKDHIYADGYANTVISMVVDYEWADFSSTMVTDSYSDPEDETGKLATVQVAENFNGGTDAAGQATLLRIPDLFSTIGAARNAGNANIQFVVDASHKNPQILDEAYFSSKGIGLKVETELNTGMTLAPDAETELPVLMQVTGIEASDATDGNGVTYSVNYKLYGYDAESAKIYKVSDNSEIASVDDADSHHIRFTVEFPDTADGVETIK